MAKRWMQGRRTQVDKVREVKVRLDRVSRKEASEQGRGGGTQTGAGEKNLLSQSGIWSQARRTSEQEHHYLSFTFLCRSNEVALMIYCCL